MFRCIRLFGDLSLFNNQPPFVKASRRLHEGFKKAPRYLRGACLRGDFVEPVSRLCESFVEVPCTEGSTKTPWRVHEASSKGSWRNFVGLLNDDACNRVGSMLCLLALSY